MQTEMKGLSDRVESLEQDGAQQATPSTTPGKEQPDKEIMATAKSLSEDTGLKAKVRRHLAEIILGGQVAK